MRPVGSLQPFYEALVTTLQGDTTLMAGVSGIFKGVADEGARYPYVIFHVQDAPARHCFQGGGHSQISVLVKVVADGFSSAVAAGLHARILDRLINESLWTAPNGWNVLGVLVEQLIDEPETDGETALQHVGAVYTVLVERT